MNINKIKFTTENIEIVMDTLPQFVLEIFSVIGKEKGIILINKFSGRRLPFTNGRRNHAHSIQTRKQLIDLIGNEATDRLINSIYQYSSSNFLTMPNCIQARRKLRNISIIRDYDSMIKSGISDIKAIDKLTEKYGLAIRQLRYIMKKPLNI